MRAHHVVVRAAAAAITVPVLALGAQPRAATAPAPAETLLGLTAAASGSGRDTLGLLVVAVAHDGPADRAGITEGSRLSEINGVSLRLTPTDVTDREGGAAVVRRLDRELRAVRPGDGVVLRLAGAGSGRTVTVATVGPPAAPAAPPPAAPPPAASPTAAPLPSPRAAVDHLPVARGPGADEPARPATLAAVIEALGELQTQLHRLARDEPAVALADTLTDVEDELGPDPTSLLPAAK